MLFFERVNKRKNVDEKKIILIRSLFFKERNKVLVCLKNAGNLIHAHCVQSKWVHTMILNFLLEHSLWPWYVFTCSGSSQPSFQAHSSSQISFGQRRLCLCLLISFGYTLFL